jgi:DNA-binding NarL/FixJ family response regulator
MTFAPMIPDIHHIPDGAIRPLIIDAHAGSRLGMALLLQRERWVGRCLIARDSQDGVELAARHRPEVALLDVSNAGPFVASAAAELRRAHAGVRIVLTSRCARELATPPQTVGAAGFLAPDASPQEIVSVVLTAVLSLDAQAPQTSAVDPDGLSERERRLLSLISTGATNKEIAQRLHLGPDSVKKNASSLYRKLGVRNRTEAAQRAADLLAPA